MEAATDWHIAELCRRPRCRRIAGHPMLWDVWNFGRNPDAYSEQFDLLVIGADAVIEASDHHALVEISASVTDFSSLHR